MMAKQSTSGEDSLIARYFRPLATDPGAFGLGDDAAVLKALGEDIVVTTDAIVEGVHFLPDDPPDTIARKALRVNLSDLAAKGATPAGFVLTLALRSRRRCLARAVRARAWRGRRQFGCPLLGGDTVSTPGPLMISITAFGRVPPGKMVHRSGAKPGDRVVVTGTIGDAALGLDILKGGSGRCGACRRRRGKGDAGRALSRAAAAQRAGARRCAITRMRRWMCPTVLPAIWQSCARRPAYRP